MNSGEEEKANFLSKAFRLLFALGFFVSIASLVIGALVAVFFFVTDRSVFSPVDSDRIERECKTIIRPDGSSFDTCDFLVP